MDFITAVELASPILHAFEAPEGFAPEPYDDGYGFSTIGYGHLIRPDESYTRITKRQAQALLEQDVQIAIYGLQKYLTPECLEELEANEIASLICLVFNIGNSKFRTSTLRQYLNAGLYEQAIYEFPKWRRSAGRISRGLVRRRACEALYFDKAIIDFYANISYPEYVY